MGGMCGLNTAVWSSSSKPLFPSGTLTIRRWNALDEFPLRRSPAKTKPRDLNGHRYSSQRDRHIFSLIYPTVTGIPWGVPFKFPVPCPVYVQRVHVGEAG